MDILRIKELLKEKNVTGKDLAEKVGVSTVSMSNIVSGNSFPKPELLKNIAEVLDVDIRELFIPTKEDNKEAIYIKKDGKMVNIGSLEVNL
ncbi:helix-turn-helix transcriptional regulator [Antarcticibacterium flavum]|uniref:Helix-turn-helix transcriptional regulator n=1 Tax=Antarcticibacterium flavum TaxID=2058175 RepID=A0A5B7X6P5_9FLAO|nr:MULTISPECIES: helix-turn-helix transcriptional regulator [Antarcticibacterium]MCM4159532.1 XRE family transcriptional regulator [Antarcticibacterium sp. W02-3]QCY70785.1 helix-turn-helix transcriptional regulator [Antarcticibacterium flavum]